jgi:hypothetical protein
MAFVKESIGMYITFRVCAIVDHESLPGSHRGDSSACQSAGAEPDPPDDVTRRILTYTSRQVTRHIRTSPNGCGDEVARSGDATLTRKR